MTFKPGDQVVVIAGPQKGEHAEIVSGPWRARHPSWRATGVPEHAVVWTIDLPSRVVRGAKSGALAEWLRRVEPPVRGNERADLSESPEWLKRLCSAGVYP